MKRQYTNHKIVLMALILAGAMAFSGSAIADVELSVLPSTVTIDPGAVFNVDLTITQPGSAFNGYDAVIGYDPEFLEFIILSGGNQEGPLMIDACPERFHEIVATPNSGELTIHHVLLCAGVSTSGPGVVHRVRFQAKQQNGSTQIIVMEGTDFFLAGSEVTPLITNNATIVIGDLSATQETPNNSALDLLAAPNPFNPLTLLSFAVADPGAAQLDVFTPDGRRIKQLARTYLETGHHEFWWDGTNERGQFMGSGVYFVRLLVGREMAMRSVTLVK